MYIDRTVNFTFGVMPMCVYTAELRSLVRQGRLDFMSRSRHHRPLLFINSIVLDHQFQVLRAIYMLNEFHAYT